MTSPTMVRTFSRAHWLVAEAAWRLGDFSPEWDPWRKLAADVASIIDPPTGTKWDSWADDDPSQRAVLIRAIRETPDALEDAIRADGVHSWAVVVAIVLRHLSATRHTVDERAETEEAAWERTKAAERDEAPAALERIGWPS